MSSSSLKEFLTKPRAQKQFGSFPLFVILRGERWFPGLVQDATFIFCALLFALGLVPQLTTKEFSWGGVATMVAALGITALQQLYYTRKGQNYFQLVCSQYREDKENIARLKKRNLG